MNPLENLSNAVSALENASERIRRIEEEARQALLIRDDPEKYRQKLREKTMLLMELSELVGPFCEAMSKDVRVDLETGLNSFATRAAQALELSSIFYMSALLYPEGYREGDLNDLELFIDRLRTRYLS